MAPLRRSCRAELQGAICLETCCDVAWRHGPQHEKNSRSRHGFLARHPRREVFLLHCAEPVSAVRRHGRAWCWRSKRRCLQTDVGVCAYDGAPQTSFMDLTDKCANALSPRGSFTASVAGRAASKVAGRSPQSGPASRGGFEHGCVGVRRLPASKTPMMSLVLDHPVERSAWRSAYSTFSKSA